MHENKKRYSKYTADQKLVAIEHYFKHEQCISRTVEALGYPSRPILTQWVKSESDCISNLFLVECSQTKRLLAEGCGTNMSKAKDTGKTELDHLSKQSQELVSEKEMLSKQIEILQQEVRQLQLKKDVLEKAAEVIKKIRALILKHLPWGNVTVEQFIEQLNIYIKWYAEKRIKLSLGGMSPLDYRLSLGLVA